MKKIFFVLMLLTSAAFGYSFAPTGATPIKFDASGSGAFTFNNTCTGEMVTLNYTSDFSVRGVINGNRVSLSFHIQDHYDGTGNTSGANYQGSGNLNETVNFSLNNGQGEVNFVEHVIITTAGGGNNLKINASFHLTVNANGDVTVSRGDFSVVCQ